MNNHLFIVCSPLQLKIALAIKKHYKNDVFHIIYLQTKSGFKEFVNLSLRNDFDTFHIANMDYDIINFRRIVSYLKNNVAGSGYVYLANANDITVQYILSQLSDDIILRTFDDGILNINTIIDLNHKIKKRKKLKHILTRLFYKNTFSIREIIDRTSLHFTILEHNRTLNVRAQLIKIDIFDSNDVTLNDNINHKDAVCNIFVGSKFKDILANKSTQQLNELIHKIKRLNVIFDNLIYLRHPREILEEKFSMQEISVDSISEDYIYELARQGYIINVIGFASTCQLNTMNLLNVNIVLLETNLIRQDILDSFSLFTKSETVSIHNIDE